MSKKSKASSKAVVPFLVVFTLVMVVAALFVTMISRDIVASRRSTEVRSYANEPMEATQPMMGDYSDY